MASEALLSKVALSKIGNTMEIQKKGKVVKSEVLATCPQRSYLRAKFSILSEICPLDRGNPTTCPIYKVRKSSLKERLAWLDDLSEDTVLNIYTYCRLCLEVKDKTV